jgi:hypothetical protein
VEPVGSIVELYGHPEESSRRPGRGGSGRHLSCLAPRVGHCAQAFEEAKERATRSRKVLWRPGPIASRLGRVPPPLRVEPDVSKDDPFALCPMIADDSVAIADCREPREAKPHGHEWRNRDR